MGGAGGGGEGEMSPTSKGWKDVDRERTAEPSSVGEMAATAILGAIQGGPIASGGVFVSRRVVR